MTDTQQTAGADLTRLGREAVGRMRLPGPPLGKPLPSRIGSLASSVERFASSLSRPVEIRRSLRGPGSHEDSVRPPRWWTGQTPESPSRDGAAVPAGRWLADAQAVRREALPPRSLPRAARAVPNEETYTPGGILNGLHAEVARVRRLSEVAAAGAMTSTADFSRLGAATVARRRAEAARTLPPPMPVARPVAAPAAPVEAAPPETAPVAEPEGPRTPRASSPRPSGAPRAAARPAPKATPAPAPDPNPASSALPAGAASPAPARPAAVVRRSTKKTASKPSAPAASDSAPAAPSGPSREAAPSGTGASAPAGAGPSPAGGTPSGPGPAAGPDDTGSGGSAAPGSPDGSGSPAPTAGGDSAAPASSMAGPSGASDGISVAESASLSEAPAPAGSTAALAEVPAGLIRRRASFQLRPTASRLAASFSRAEPTRSAAAPSRAAGVLRRSVATGETIRAASGTLIASAPGLGAREAHSAAGIVRRLARGHASEPHAAPPAPLRVVPGPPSSARPAPTAPGAPASVVPSPAAPNGAAAPSPAAGAPASAASPSGASGRAPSTGSPVTPLRRLAAAPAPAESVASEPAAPVTVRRTSAGSLSRATGRWAAETLAGGSPTLAGLGVPMPDLMATRRVSDRSGDGPLASGFGGAAEIRPATGDLIGSVGSSSARLATPAAGGVVRRSHRPRVVSSGLPLLTPQLMAHAAFQGPESGGLAVDGSAFGGPAFGGSAGASDAAAGGPAAAGVAARPAPGASARGAGRRGPSGPAGRAPASPAGRPGAPALPGHPDHGDGPSTGTPALRRLPSLPRPSSRGAAGVPGGTGAPHGAAGDIVRRAVIRRLFDGGEDDGPAPGEMVDQRKAAQKGHRELLRATYGRKRPATPSDPEAAKKQREEHQGAIEQMRKNSPYSRDTSRRARAARGRLEQEGGGVKKPPKSLLESTEHLFVTEDENGAKRATPTAPAPVTKQPAPGDTSALSPAERRERRRGRRMSRVEMDRLTDAVVARIEQRVVDELERRGRRDGRGGF